MGMVDAMVGLLLLAIAGILFTAIFPTGFSAVRQARESERAVVITQQKLEQLRALGYESLSYPNLRSGGVPVVDETPTTSPYSFTETDNLASFFSGVSSTLAITDDSTHTKKVVVTITWKSSSGATHTMTAQTLITDKRPWKGS
jgi:type II secretory pathway pseudopilin PulG